MKYCITMNYEKEVTVEAKNKQEAITKAHAGEWLSSESLQATLKDEVEEIDNDNDDNENNKIEDTETNSDCPVCGSDKVEFLEEIRKGDNLYIEKYCEDCGTYYTEQYKISKI